MAEYEPDDSRDVTHSKATAPGEPPRTGPREDAARADARDERTVPARDGERALEGDRPDHPDRFGGTAAGSAKQANDRWADKAARDETAGRDDSVPDGK
ncbi:hypothetical protein GRI40_10510 [Altererythrobacter aerius]|uniref:Uncharacterized protein n=1 Tax=Tsuneonella aeria TaxID=1837929 RepID=A0A6I4TGL0_9SPHN|nr:hypothetical protein [Tsuneonella aeria]MXO75648.1 hypothetical protein [Tsuneonella aeria]